MAWLVAQSGLQGLRWEIMNEPDGGNGWPNTHIAAALYVQMMKLVYTAMKASDPTCTIYGLCLESLSPTGLGFGDGLTYYLQCVALGIIGYYDALSFHIYSWTVSFTNNNNPADAIGGYGFTQSGLIGNARSVMLANGDSVPMVSTEFSWQWESSGTATTKSQAQYTQDFLVRLTHVDAINNVLYSSYLIGMYWYCVTSQGGSQYAIYPTDTTANPVQAILAELVAGN